MPPLHAAVSTLARLRTHVTSATMTARQLSKLATLPARSLSVVLELVKERSPIPAFLGLKRHKRHQLRSIGPSLDLYIPKASLEPCSIKAIVQKGCMVSTPLPLGRLTCPTRPSRVIMRQFKC
jgi:hypothetical protein